MPPPGYEPFLATVLDDPGADGPRLVYADWLEEQGDARADLIRVQVESANLPAGHPKRETLADRAGVLLHQFGEEWGKELPEWARTKCEYHRGFVDEVHVWTPWEGSFGAEISGAAPVEKVILHHVAEATKALAAGPGVRHLKRLAFLDSRMGPGDLRAMCLSPTAFRGIASLEFMGMNLMDTGGLLISLCEQLGSLQRLDLVRCSLESRGIVMLADAPNLPRLEWLDLSDNELTNDMVYYLAHSKMMSRLTTLHMNDNDLTNAAVRALTESAEVERLTRLELAGNHVGEEGARLILDRFPALEHLDLSRNPLTIAIQVQLKAHFGNRVWLGAPGEIPPPDTAT